eukprot:3269426-Rhodomonas_salina.1
MPILLYPLSKSTLPPYESTQIRPTLSPDPVLLYPDLCAGANILDPPLYALLTCKATDLARHRALSVSQMASVLGAIAGS